MKIEFANKFWDVFLFSVTHQFYSPALQVLIVGFALLVTFPGMLHGVLNGDVTGAISLLSEAGLIYLFLWALQFIFNAIYLYSKKQSLSINKSYC